MHRAVFQLLMSVFENSMKTYNVLENDPYDWERSDSEDSLTVAALAATGQQLTRLTPAYLGYVCYNAPVRFPLILFHWHAMKR